MVICVWKINGNEMKEIKNKRCHYHENDKGQKHGEYKRYWSNGQLDIHCHYNNDQWHGEYKSYWDNGQVWYHGHFNKGQLHGEYKRHHDNGQLWVHAYDVNDIEVHDFLKDGDTPEIRMFLYFTYAAPFLDNNQS